MSMASPVAMLWVRAPDTYRVERKYAFDVILSEWLGFDYELHWWNEPRVSICLPADRAGLQLTGPDVLFSARAQDWLTERSMPALPLVEIHAEPDRPRDANERETSPLRIPVLYGEVGDGRGAWLSTPDGLHLTIDVFGSVFFLLTRYEELVRGDRDQHGRFPAASSLAMSGGYMERPLADEYVDILWSGMHRLWPTISRRHAEYRLRLTHDVDQPWSIVGQRARTVVHDLARDVLSRRDPKLLLRRARTIALSRSGCVDGDPFNTFDFLMETSERYGIASVFNVMAVDRPTSFDGRYRLGDPQATALLRRIRERGHEVGLHASYASHASVSLLQNEFAALRTACGAIGLEQGAWGVRHHYLRFDAPLTWRCQAAAKLDYDSTLGYADAVGFRAGTCREFHVFDLLSRRPLNLRERPLLAMDATLSEYLGLRPPETIDRIRAIVSQCRRHRGDAVLLFHNNRLTGDRQRGAYREMVNEMASPR